MFPFDTCVIYMYQKETLFVGEEKTKKPRIKGDLELAYNMHNNNNMNIKNIRLTSVAISAKKYIYIYPLYRINIEGGGKKTS